MDLNKIKIFLPHTVLFMICSLVIAGCKSTSHTNNAGQVNPELSGVWNDDSGCTATFAKESSIMLLVKFDDSRGNHFNNIKMAYTKDGVMTKLIPFDTKIPFTVNYMEGIMTIDQYCKAPLNKVANSQN